MSNFTKSVSLGAHNIAFSLLRKLVGTIPQVWEQSRPFLRWRVNLLWEQTQEGGNFLRACELADTTVPLYYDDDDDDDDDDDCHPSFPASCLCLTRHRCR